MRRLVALVAVAVCLLGGSAVAAELPGVQLPRDHYGHPSSQIEWWYFSALVSDSSGTRYSVFFTLFSGFGFVLVPDAQVVNLDSGAVVGHSEGLALGTPGSSALDVNVAGARFG